MILRSSIPVVVWNWIRAVIYFEVFYIFLGFLLSICDSAMFMRSCAICALYLLFVFLVVGSSNFIVLVGVYRVVDLIGTVHAMAQPHDSVVRCRCARGRHQERCRCRARRRQARHHARGVFAPSPSLLLPHVSRGWRGSWRQLASHCCRSAMHY